MSTTQTRSTQATRDLFEPRADAALVPFEDIREEIASAPQTISVLAAKDVKKAAEAAAELQSASIRLTYPSDWIVFRAKDGQITGYLQDAGCQRVRPLWGISFAKFSPRTDLEESTTPDGHYLVDAYVEGLCALTGETLQEIGHRDSGGLFGPAWEEAWKAEDHLTLAKLRADVKKASIANAQGRIVRRASGLSQVPVDRLAHLLGVKADSFRGVKFREGTRGGGSSSTSDASDAQLNLIAGEAVRAKKVANAKDFKLIRGFAEDAKLTKDQASKVIETLKAAKPGAISSDQFLALLGIAPAAAAEREPGEEG
jgi:hypothetical protein